MNSSSRVAPPSNLSYLVKAVGLCGLYLGAALLGLHFASVGASVSLVWPPTGIAIAALTLWGLRYWPSIALGAFIANALTPIPIAAAVGIAVGNTVEALVAAYWLRRSTRSRPDLDDIRQVRTLVAVAAPSGAICSALIGTISLWLSGSLDSGAVPLAIAIWWIGDLLGGLIVAPLFLAWSASRNPVIDGRGLVELLLLFLGTALAAEFGLGLFRGESFIGDVNYLYLLFPFVVWAGLRLGARGATLVTFFIAVVAVGRTVGGAGPFVNASSTRTLFAFGCYLIAVAVTGLVLAAAVQWERRQATSALGKSEELRRQALDAARMGTWHWSVEGNTLTWDDNLRRLYGLEPGTPISGYQDFISRVHPDDRQFVEQSVRRVLERDGDLDYEFRILLPDGRVRWIADQGEIRRDEQGRPRYLTGICTDVTERRVAEERLRQAHRMESVGRLAGGVAHETNNQMSVVLGSSTFILKRSDIPESVRMDVEFIQKAAERTAAVTAQLLAFSRRQVLKPESLDLNTVIGNWEPVLRRIMGEDCGVLLRLDPQIGSVRADPGQLEQVLLNLALNARDAMPRGGSITVETFPAELDESYVRGRPGTAVQPGDYAVLAVTDTGHGMDKETLSHVFEPFFTTKGVGQGTGLGLSTVYGIVKQSDGYVWVYSEPGKGTTFKIYLPARSELPTPIRRDSSPGRTLAGETVLVVEDDPPVRSVIARTLEEAGYRVIQAVSGADAVETMTREGNKVRLVLTDVVMQGMNGRDLADRVEELVPGTPVLFTSGYTDGEIARRGLLRPGVAFIQKPLTPRALVAAVQKTIAAAIRPRAEFGGGA